MRGNRVDANQSEIVQAWRMVGALWLPTSGDPSIGFDGLLIHRGATYIVEVKDGSKPPSERKLTPREMTRKAEIEARGVKYHIVKSVNEALAMIGVKA